MSKKRTESFFWVSYSDMMTSLFFIMLLLFVLSSAGMYITAKKAKDAENATKKELEEIRKVQESTKDLSTKYFSYIPSYKKFQLKVTVAYPSGRADINELVVKDKEATLNKLKKAGQEIQSFLHKHKENQYLIIIEGQASKDNYLYNYELSYQRALGLIKYWCQDMQLSFRDNCEILICGSGDGTIDTHSSRYVGDEIVNQRFLIHILPKNIIEETESSSLERLQGHLYL